ncbi:MAG: 3-phosphoshikimate 1-carboxyvinyltransferase, partial [Oscillospiraceae bacterium]|nr:3-phosphoshikimate 1-carboxyvinyltransferase [Oscillospiraceae bacterium]
MNVTIFPGKLSGTVAVPPSKSAAHRGLIAAALKGRHGDVCRRRGGVCDKCVVAPIDLSEDIAATIRGLEAMGGAFAIQGDTVTVDGGGMFSTEMPEIDCGESGSTLRFLMPLAAAGNGGVFFGKGRLPERPIGIYETLFAEHGAKIERAGAALTVRPGLRPGRYRLPGDVSSQFITGLMLALPLLGGSGEIELISPLESKGYVGMTRSVMAQFGIRTQKTENGWRIPGNQRYTADAFAVEADWSQAAFWLAAGALGGEITLTGLDDKSPQGDSAAEQLFTGFGAQITTDNNRITVSRGILRPQDIDAAQIPDLIPALAVTAALAAGESKIYGGGRLRLKESDRI